MSVESPSLSNEDPSEWGCLPEVPEVLDGIDMEEGLSNMDGSQRLYRKVLVNLARRCCSFMDQLTDNMNRGDGMEIRRMFHTLKGVAATVGAMELRDRSLEMEQYFGEGKVGWEGVPEPQISSFKMALNRIVNSLSVLDGQMEGGGAQGDASLSGGARSPDDPCLTKALKCLEQAIVDGDGEVKVCLHALSRLLGEKVKSDLYRELACHVDNYDFEQAALTLRRLWLVLRA
ncbi:MAG: Hpt domain-containing protein [Magnetococcales bacterium]|nr:Hpt domain-containing protein [Magnetococcales bacterium]MBF0150693.1 Hpt domain-containing protein [Magnetococcales bacterium]MBF0175189.1 Hpt domain-containing protein [Magnetococcales bacterium]MBF0631685.1 Hpt domain-containing protein [Magnetococcales bacterium]